VTNRLELDGSVVRTPDTRYSPAGIPITRFVLEHRSRQAEAGLEREVYCRIGVVACGEALAAKAKAPGTGDRVRVSGFIERNTNRQGEPRLVLHAVEIEPID
jgi:primosomal replication protein N